jgi:hypothetical protein
MNNLRETPRRAGARKEKQTASLMLAGTGCFFLL